MGSSESLRSQLGAVVARVASVPSSADLLCRACVDLLEVDGAALSFIHPGGAQGTLGSSGEVSRRIDELQFTLAEGPCLDSVRQASAVLVPDIRTATQRWPAFVLAAQDLGMGAVFAVPVAAAGSWIGALDLYLSDPGPLSAAGLSGGRWGAALAALPVLDLISTGLDLTSADHGVDGWVELESLARVEVYQATGMIMGQLHVGNMEALVRLRAHASTRDRTPSEVAWDVVERRLTFAADGQAFGPTPNPYPSS